MRFSIITVCYNESRRIKKTLETVYGQTFRNFEHIIEDNCSNDGTLDIVKECEQYYDNGQLKIFSEKDNGLYDAMNKAIQKAKGEYICFINSGDYLFDEDTLSKIDEEITRTGSLDIYHGVSMIVFPNMDSMRESYSELDSENKDAIERILSTGNTGLIHQAVYANKKCFSDCLFDTKYKLRAELKWYYECLSKGYTIKKMKFPVCKYSYGGLSERVSSIKVSYNETLKILDDFKYPTEQYCADYYNCDNAAVKNSIIYNQWLALLQAGYSVKKYFDRHQIKKIAIYGYAEYARHLINELKNTEIEIAYVIDKRKLYPYEGIPILHPKDELGEVDVIVVTAITQYNDIRKYLSSRTSCQIVSLEEVLEEIWYL